VTPFAFQFLAMGADGQQIAVSAAVFLLAGAAGAVAYRPAAQLLRRQEHMYEVVLQHNLLMDVRPRSVTLLGAALMIVLALLGYVMTGSALGAVLGLGVGAAGPPVVLWQLKKRRIAKLEDQLVSGVQTLASGVRAGLNLVQSMQLLSQDGPPPLRQEIAHLLREYEYGMPLEEAMDNAAGRIESGDYRLLFAALQTHRERGGDLGETLDRIGESIREIQRLENRVKTLTAEGRATARWLGLMPVVIMGIIYFFVSPEGVVALFSEPLGKLIVLLIVALNLAGFLWIRKIVSVDV
jgi:tight adherence protein B